LSATCPRVYPFGVFPVCFHTYVIFCPPYGTMLEVLRPAYGEAIEWLGTGTGREGSYRDPDTQLAEHLMLYYARGGLGREDALFRRFWRRRQRTCVDMP
jgi:hypothetical protein